MPATVGKQAIKGTLGTVGTPIPVKRPATAGVPATVGRQATEGSLATIGQ
jgi:hypothetical protein